MLITAGCTTTQQLATVNKLDLPRFMGTWHVLADVPTPFDRNATEPLEHYALNPDGTVATTYSFIPAGGEKRRNMRARGFVRSDSGAVWGMQFIWPIQADYRVMYVSDDYDVTVVGRNKRDFVWIMSREPEIPDEDFLALLEKVSGVGYDLSRLRFHQQPSHVPAS